MRLFRHVLLALALHAVPATAHAEWQRGVDFATYAASTYGTAASDASLARAAASGNDSASIVITQYMDNATSNTVHPNGATPTDASILHAMATARSLGLKVTLKPQVDVLTGIWRGAIAPSDASAWFASYEAMIDHYADLARQGGASMLVIGTEFMTLSGPAYTTRWQQIIGGIRQRFSGQLTYASNWDEYKRVQFWGSLDYIGVDAYYRLSDLPAPTVSQLVSAWTTRGYVDALRASSQQYGKQILFTEIGYRSIVGAAIHPNIWNSQAAYSMDEEANAYEAAFQAFSGRTWFAGMYWWSWPASLPANGWNGDYTPTFKPAEDVMRTWNQKLGAGGGPVAGPAPAAPVTPPIPAQPMGLAPPSAVPPQVALPIDHKIIQPQAKAKKPASKKGRHPTKRHGKPHRHD
jgi:hypothetical protein